MAATADDLAATLRATDHARYLSTLYAPQEKRAALTALYAFNAELASIRDRAKDPMPGEIRLQWWRDVLDGGAVGGSPLAVGLVRAVESHDLPVSALKNMIDARDFDLYDDPMPSRGDLEGYLGETVSALIQLACLVLDREAAAKSAEAAGHAGCAQGIAGLLGLIPLHRARGQCYVPVDILAAAGSSRDGFVADDDADAARRIGQAMAALGSDHWEKFVKSARDLPQSLRPAFLAASVAPLLLRAAAKAGASVLRQPIRVSAWRVQWTMLRRASRGWPG